MTRIPYETIPIQDSGEPLVALGDFSILTEPVYFQQGVSDDPVIRARRGVAERLQRVQTSLGDKYRLKVWDAHRPRSVQTALYDAFRDEIAMEHPDATDEEIDQMTGDFVTKASDPDRIPAHATGGTVDLTLVDAAGNELDMGTAFDHFGPESAPLYFAEMGRDERVRENRQRLFDAMAEAGFLSHEHEWWHFDYGNQAWAYRSGNTIAKYGEAFV